MTRDPALRKLVQRNLLYFLLPNIVFNACIPYFSFKEPRAVFLFHGEFCFARFLLPMVLLLPFIVTFDILKKAITLSEQGKTTSALPEGHGKNKFMFKMAGANAGITFVLVGAVLVLAEILRPSNYVFDGLILSILLGLLAGSFTVIFTIMPIAKFRQMQLIQVPDTKD